MALLRYSFLSIGVWIMSALALSAHVQIGLVDFVQYPESHFRHISEYFTQSENTSEALIVRTQPTVRSGLYCRVYINQDVRYLPKDACVQLECVRSDSPQRHSLVFPLQPTTDHWIYIGLTDTHWQQVQASDLLCWQVTLRTADGVILAQEHSFLWSK